jgi:hypothetical protein
VVALLGVALPSIGQAQGQPLPVLTPNQEMISPITPPLSFRPEGEILPVTIAVGAAGKKIPPLSVRLRVKNCVRQDRSTQYGRDGAEIILATTNQSPSAPSRPVWPASRAREAGRTSLVIAGIVARLSRPYPGNMLLPAVQRTVRGAGESERPVC